MLVACGLGVVGGAALHLSFLRLQEKNQARVLREAVPLLQNGRASQDAPPEVLWGRGMAADLVQSAHPAFARLLADLPWPTPSEKEATVTRPDGRSFRLRVEALGYRQDDQRLFLALETTRDAELARQVLLHRGLTVLILAILSFAFGDIIFCGAMRPLKDLALKAASIRPRDLGQRLSPADFPPELRDLVHSLNASLERLQEAFQRMEHLSTDLAHELRSPIQNIRAEIEGLLLHPPTEADRTEILGSALEEMDRLAAMIEQMLFLARCEDPSSELRLGPLPVPGILQEMADYFEASADAADVALKVESEAIAVLADRALLQRALGNLISNALRHTPPGGTITLRGRKEGDRHILEVIDTGCGIPKEVQIRLGTRFTRVEDSRSRTTGGSGLGLAIVKGIMRLHGGTLEVDSRLNEGTAARLNFQADPLGRSRPGRNGK